MPDTRYHISTDVPVTAFTFRINRFWRGKNMMKRIVLVGLISFCVNSVEADPPDDFIDSLLTAHNTVGLAACAYYGDSLIWDGYFGVKNFSYVDSLVNDTTLFFLYSCSKPFTAITFMQLWEQGLVELDVDVGDYLPYEIRNPYFPDTPITPRMIMSHTSSLRADVLFFDGELEAGDSTYSNTDYIAEVYVPGGIWYDSTANFYQWEPGSQHSYNLHRSQSVLAAIVEQVSTYSDSFDLHCREYIFDPLGMDLTSYLITSVDTMNVGAAYTDASGGAVYGCYPSAPSYPGWLLKTNPLEYAQPLVAFMQGGEIGGTRILDETTVDTMMTAHYPTLDAEQGLGWRKIGNFYGRLIWGHNGGDTSVTYFCPAENSAVIVLQNFGPTQVRMAAMNYLFNYIAEQMGIEESALTSPLQLAVSPNPFSSTASVSFELPDTGPVSIQVFDLSGRLVATVADDVMTAGEHSVVLSAANLESGLYFIRLNTGGRAQVSSAVLIR